MGEFMENRGKAETVKGTAEGGGERRRRKEGLVKWERFLPKIALRVLVVEADDSTRQIICALLKKCSYKVAAVPDGLKAWEIIKARSDEIDLILTEVDLPSISGYALLSLVMEHEICKNIPIIMMSSHDSVSTVYKCMLRGAADYLLKPLRRNELMNLWQHVWRRRLRSSIAAGSLPENESIGQQKIQEASENNSTTNQDRTEKETDAQGSCTKPDVEAESADIEKNPKEFRGSESLLNNTERPETEPITAMDNANCCNVTRFGGTNSSKEAIDFMGASLFRTNNTSATDDGISSSLDPQLGLHLSLTRSQPMDSNIDQSTGEKAVLRPSTASAFTRYVNRPPVQTSSSMFPGISDHMNPNSPGPPPPPSNIPTSWTMSVPENCVEFNDETRNNDNDHYPSSAYGSGSSVSPQENLSCQLRIWGCTRNVSPTTEQSLIRSLSNGVYDRASGSGSNCNVDHHHHHHHVAVVNDSENGNSSTENRTEKGFPDVAGSSQRSLQREAALNKFRMKRKDRCFEKKVRYESRKKLAEQRPRVKGQFVRQAQLPASAQDNSNC